MTPSSTTASPGTQESPESSAERTGRGGWFAFAAIAWLVATLSMLRLLLAPESGDLALATVAGSLLQLILAGVLAGAAMGLWAGAEMAARRPAFATGGLRRLVAAVAGLATGALASMAVLAVRGMPSEAVWVLATTLGIAGAMGGALSTIRPQAIVYSGAVAALANVFLFNLLQINSDWLLDAFGADGTAAGDQAAAGYLSATQALVAGILGGYVAYRLLRREDRVAGIQSRWPAYLLAGGIPGLLWIAADLLTRIGVSRLLELATTDAAGDRLIQQNLGASRLNTGLVLFFVGAITAIVAFGRKLPKKAAD